MESEVVFKVSSSSFNWTSPKCLNGAFKLLTFWSRLQLVFDIFGIAISNIQSITEYVWNTASNIPPSDGRPEDCVPAWYRHFYVLSKSRKYWYLMLRLFILCYLCRTMALVANVICWLYPTWYKCYPIFILASRSIPFWSYDKSTHLCVQSLTLSQWSSSGKPVAIQCAWNLDPSVHWMPLEK